MATKSPYHELSARGRIESVIDEGSFFEFLAPPEREMSPYLEKLDQPVSFDDGIVIGRATMGGHSVYLAAQEGKFVGGSVGEVHGAKMTGLLKAAARDKVPCVLLVESGGVRLHEGSSGENSWRPAASTRARKRPAIACVRAQIASRPSSRTMSSATLSALTVAVAGVNGLPPPFCALSVRAQSK